MKVEFADGYAVGFHMAVGECFRQELLKERFSIGDTIYDTRLAYEGNWAEALLRINYCFKVASEPSEHVEFEVMRPNDQRTNLVVTERIKESVNEFIERLRNGHANA